MDIHSKLIYGLWDVYFMNFYALDYHLVKILLEIRMLYILQLKKETLVSQNSWKMKIPENLLILSSSKTQSKGVVQHFRR